MFKKIAITTIAASALLFSMQASAAGYGHHNKRDAGINKEQREQSVMIQQGIKTCQITPAEARTLKDTQKRISRLESKFKANGLSRWESQTLHNKLHAARVEINKLTKNRTNCRSKYRSNGHGNGGRGASNDRRHGASNHGSSNGRSAGSISVTVRNIH